jgi:arsenite methyltransferase
MLSRVSDRWSQWLRTRRDGGSLERRRAALEFLGPVRDQILDSAEVKPGELLLDVGCGDGLIGLGALDRGATVIFSDISDTCLDDCRAVAGDSATYRVASATHLGDLSVDVVTTRAVLIYVGDKQLAFDEFFRVLRPGGRISLFEPINRFGLTERQRTYGFRSVERVEHLLAKVVDEIDRVEEEAGGLDPMIDFDERDLVTFAERAGFEDIRLTLVVEVTNTAWWRTRNWEVFLDSSPNPLAPTFREAMRAALTTNESEQLAASLRPQVENGDGTTRLARALLKGVKTAA